MTSSALPSPRTRPSDASGRPVVHDGAGRSAESASVPTGMHRSLPVLDGVHLRHPSAEDGAALWTLARDSGKLDLNSPYAYLMMSAFFAETCLLAEDAEGPLGGVIGFAPPQRPSTLFVWQVTVAHRARGRGLASRMVEHLLWSAPLTGSARWLEASVTPSNTASEALFRGIARRHEASCAVTPLFSSALFPAEAGPLPEPERLFRIGPLHQQDRRAA